MDRMMAEVRLIGVGDQICVGTLTQSVKASGHTLALATGAG